MLLITGTPQSGQALLAGHLLKYDILTSPGAIAQRNFLDPQIQNINNEILRLSKCTWCDAPITSELYSTGAIEYRMSAFLSRYPDIDFLKDSRFCITFRAWKPLFSDLDFLICFREPGETAQSLKAQCGLTISEGLTLWRQYYQRVVSLNCAFIEFGSTVPFEDYLDNVGRAFRFLELDVPTEPLHRLWDQNKIHEYDSVPLPLPVQKLYQLLQSRTEN